MSKYEEQREVVREAIDRCKVEAQTDGEENMIYFEDEDEEEAVEE